MPVLAALWGMGLLTIISVSLLWSATESQVLARSAMEAAEIDMSVEAAVNRAVLALLASRAEQRWQTNGTAQMFEFNATRMMISIQDELGLLDLNQAEPSVLTRLMQGAGLDRQSATGLVDKILDWRDSTSLRRLNGAKDSDYRDAGRTYRPREGSFQSVGELRLVMGMTPALFSRVESAVTVYSGRQFVDSNVAPPQVLAALQNSGARDALPTGSNQQSLTTQLAVGSAAQLRGRAFTVKTTVEKAGNQISQQATIRLTENAHEPFWLLNWRLK